MTRKFAALILTLALLTSCGAAPASVDPAPAPPISPAPVSISAEPAPMPAVSVPTPPPTATPAPTASPAPTTALDGTYPNDAAKGVLYSLNPSAYTYHPIIGRVDSKALAELAAYKPVKDGKPEEKPIDPLGFLAKYKDGSKESYSVTATQLISRERGVLDATAEQCKALHNLAKAKNAENVANAQWLAYMSPEKLTKVEFSGNALDDAMTGISFTTDDSKIMASMARKLSNLIIKPGSTKRIEGAVNFNTPAGLMTLKLTFGTGVVYDIYITDDNMDVISSDMSYSLNYTLISEDNCEGLRRHAERLYYNLHPELKLPIYMKTNPDAKPVIYLYPEKQTDVSVKLDYKGEMTYTFPTIKDGGWNVTAYPDGRLVNKSDNTEHYYLFWEGVSDTQWKFDEGFCVAGGDTEAFLREKLAYMGLTPREYNDFITFWVPLLKSNPYNLITFSGEQYEQLAPLTVTPAPDSVLRVHMVYKPLTAKQSIPEQKLKPFERKGFTVVEWGGSSVG